MSALGPLETAALVGEKMYERDRFAQFLGIRILDTKPGFARAEMEVTRDLLNGFAIGHGGAIFALADTTFAYACNSRNEANVAISCSISFLSPCQAGEILHAVAEERATEGRNGVYDVTITGDDDRILAVFRGNSRQIRGETVPDLT